MGTTIELINLPRIHSTINSAPLKEHFLSLSLFSTLDNVFKHFSSACRLFKDTSFISFMSKSQVLRIRRRCGSEKAGVLFQFEKGDSKQLIIKTGVYY